MNPEFITILKKLIAEQGKEVLFNPSKCKAFLADYTHGDYKKESRLLIQTIEAGIPKAIDNADELSQCKQKQIRVLHEEYFLTEEIAEDIINIILLFLKNSEEQTITSSQNKSMVKQSSYEINEQVLPNMINIDNQKIFKSSYFKIIMLFILSSFIALLLLTIFLK